MTRTQQLGNLQRAGVIFIGALLCTFLNVLAADLVTGCLGEEQLRNEPRRLVTEMLKMSPYMIGVGLLGFALGLVSLQRANLKRAIPQVVIASLAGSTSPLWLPVYGDDWRLGIIVGIEAGFTAMIWIGWRAGKRAQAKS